MTDNKNFEDYTPELQKNARLAKDWYSRICDSLEKCPFCNLKSKYIIAKEQGWALTVNLFPYIEGHLLIIPQNHIESHLQMKSGDWESISKLLVLADSLLEQALGINGYNLVLREGEHGGKSLGHLHFHLIPFEEGLVSWSYRKIRESPQETARKLREKLDECR
ncbi:MAG: HIT family protein [Patescibacteria group bacterium]|nr:HIT family protein [Patescibacteria group bacterium]